MKSHIVVQRQPVPAKFMVGIALVLETALRQGLHRSVSQIKARAPNASAPYLSTESRLGAFDKMFQSPVAVQELAAKHSDLESHSAVANAIAALVGGPTCKPARQLSHSELSNLLYRNSFKFTRGQTTMSVLPASEAAKLRRQKSRGLYSVQVDGWPWPWPCPVAHSCGPVYIMWLGCLGLGLVQLVQLVLGPTSSF